MDIKRYFNLAKNVSELSDYPRIHIGAILVYNKQIVSIGYNTLKTHPIQLHYNQFRSTSDRVFDMNKHTHSLHAETMCMLASRGLGIDYSKASIFVYSEHKDGSKRLTKPCKGCTKLLKDFGVKSVYYSTENGFKKEKI